MKSIITLASFLLISMPIQAMDLNFALEDLNLFEVEPSTVGERTEGNEQVGQSAGGHHGGEHHHNPCHHIGFSKVQKDATHAEMMAFKAHTHHLTEHLAMFGKRYHDVITDTQWNEDYANQLMDKIISMGAKLQSQRAGLLHTLVYDVATAQQRKPLLTCVKYKKIKMMKMALEKMHGHPL